MNKKYLYLIITILVISSITAYFFSTSKTLDCDNLKTEVRQSLENANYCSVDSDCEINIEFGCPFGCYNLVNNNNNNNNNNNIELNQIISQVKDYEENCPECVYDCDRLPTKEEVQCINNKCVDIRYE